MKQFCFTVDDNVRVFKELTEGDYGSIFDHPYLGMFKRLHEKHGLKIQLNLFYESDGFDLSRMTDRYRNEWHAVSDWLKLSFHSRLENVKPYEYSGYEEVFSDCQSVHREILRFASEDSLAKTTTVHYCLATAAGLDALKDNGVKGLLGLYGSPDAPRSSYQTSKADGDRIREGKLVFCEGITYTGIDVVMNLYSKEENLSQIDALLQRERIKVMIHEQYFYPDYRRYQPDFEEKIDAVFKTLSENHFHSAFFEEWL